MREAEARRLVAGVGVRAGRIAAHERVEDLLEDLGGDAAAVIAHRDERLSVARLDGDVDVAGAAVIARVRR